MSAFEDVRFPLSPYGEGIKFVIDCVMDGSVEIPQEWKDGDPSKVSIYIGGLTTAQMPETGLHPALAARPDFVNGVIHGVSRIPSLVEQASEYLNSTGANHE